LGNVPLTDATVNKEGKAAFGSKWLGVKMQNSQIPNRDGYMIMNNDFLGGSGIHWISIIKKGHNIYVYDSFGRTAGNLLPVFANKMKGRGYKIYNADTSDQDQYGSKSVTCGHRCLSALNIAKTYGIDAFMSL
jgi:hypothetical protein